MRKDPIRIALVSPGHTLPRQIMMEARRRLLRKPGCRPVLFSGKGPLEDVADWKPDGIIAHISGGSLLQALEGFHCPILNTSQVMPAVPGPSVSPDNHLIGRMAADHLRQQGFEHFAYVGRLDLEYSRQRLEGFQESLEDGTHIRMFTRHLPPPMKLERGETDLPDSFTSWILALPPHTGLFTPDDPTAAVVLDALGDLDIASGEGPGILSGHDMDWPTNPSLSAVEISNRRWGSLAAETMLTWLRDPSRTPEDVFFPPGDLVQRETTSQVPTRDPIVLQAVGYIRDHADEDLAVPDVADAIGKGRRTLERRFKQELGHSVLHEINRAHVRLAKQLLRETNDPVQKVSRQVGLEDVNRLIRIFNKFEHTSPGKYRDELRSKT